MGRARKDITGNRYGRLVAIKDIGADARNSRLWLCRCDCGNTCTRSTVRLGAALYYGEMSSCGCYNAVSLRLWTWEHGVWNGKTKRCPRNAHRLDGKKIRRSRRVRSENV